MSLNEFTKLEVASALERGVQQCVVIVPKPGPKRSLLELAPASLQVFEVDELAGETLASVLEKSEFDKLKASLFVCLGAGYRTIDAMFASLGFIASLPKGSAVLLDYVAERTSIGTITHTALDVLASKLMTAGGSVKYLIQPQAVAAMLRSAGFHLIVDQVLHGGHVVSAQV